MVLRKTDNDQVIPKNTPGFPFMFCLNTFVIVAYFVEVCPHDVLLNLCRYFEQVDMSNLE